MMPTPAAAHIVYDADCAFCRDRIAFFRSRDKTGQFDFIPSKSPDLLERFPQLKGANLDSGMRLVDASGQAHAGADAVYAILRRLPGLRWPALLYNIPGLHWIAQKAYAWIAANRHRLGSGCETDSCQVPPAPNSRP